MDYIKEQYGERVDKSASPNGYAYLFCFHVQRQSASECKLQRSDGGRGGRLHLWLAVETGGLLWVTGCWLLAQSNITFLMSLCPINVGYSFLHKLQKNMNSNSALELHTWQKSIGVNIGPCPSFLGCLARVLFFSQS